MTEKTKEAKKMCRLANLSMYCIIGVLVIIVMLILFDNFLSDAVRYMLIPTVLVLMILSLISAIASLIRIRLKPEIFRGTKTSIASLVVLSLLLIIIIVPLGSGCGCAPASEIMCRVNLHTLIGSTMGYVHNYNDMVLPESNWCDTLVMEVALDPTVLICEESGAVYGESSYAINKNAIGKKFSELPGDMVLFFETSLGCKDTGRTKEVKERPSFSKYPETSGLSGREKVYLNRWNQIGGPENSMVDYHGGKGCRVGFVDSHVEFVKAEDIGKLRWTVE